MSCCRQPSEVSQTQEGTAVRLTTETRFQQRGPTEKFRKLRSGREPSIRLIRECPLAKASLILRLMVVTKPPTNLDCLSAHDPEHGVLPLPLRLDPPTRSLNWWFGLDHPDEHLTQKQNKQRKTPTPPPKKEKKKPNCLTTPNQNRKQNLTAWPPRPP